jgi:hypothetical protein
MWKNNRILKFVDFEIIRGDFAICLTYVMIKIYITKRERERADKNSDLYEQYVT